MNKYMAHGRPYKGKRKEERSLRDLRKP